MTLFKVVGSMTGGIFHSNEHEGYSIDNIAPGIPLKEINVDKINKILIIIISYVKCFWIECKSLPCFPIFLFSHITRTLEYSIYISKTITSYNLSFRPIDVSIWCGIHITSRHGYTFTTKSSCTNSSTASPNWRIHSPKW